MTEAVNTVRNGRVLEITLDRPKANAIDAATSKLLGEAFQSLQQDDGLSVAIVTAAGERFFSAGWDLKAAAEGEAPDADQGIGGFAGLTEYWDLKKP
ncbi:MAG: carnitinyl-CoA dehydratase, partial [Gammaproteobacteria bacterium]|nr:carnitinyl-CoA dehydratase [Gammaproteobacteria bacterium]